MTRDFYPIDLPVILSEGFCGFLEPQEQIWKDQTGQGFHLSKIRAKFPCALDYFDNIKGFTIRSESFKDKTLFRFPLRNKRSHLSNKIWNIDEIHNLLKPLKEEAKYLLLFLRSVTSIKVVKITPNERYIILFKVSVADDDIERISQQKSLLCKRAEATFPIGCESQVIDDVFHFCIKLFNDNNITSCHEWIIVNQIGSKDREVCDLTKSSSQAMLPWVGSAFELTTSPHYENGRIFCFLPLPVEDRAPFAVHVHGTFAVSSNRRALKWESQERQDDEACWNKLLVNRCLPSCYTALLKYMIQQSSIRPELVYRCWPEIAKGPWAELLEPLFKGFLQGSQVVYTDVHKKWISIKDAIFIPQKDKPPQAVCDALLRCNANIVSNVRSHHMLAIRKYYGEFEFVEPVLVCTLLRSTSSSYQGFTQSKKMDILSYLLKNKVYERVTNLELLPLFNEKFIKFEASSTAYCYVCSQNIHPTLLPNLKHRLVYILNDRKDLHDQLIELAKTKATQLRVMDMHAVAKLVPLSDPSTWSQEDLKRFWDWLQDKDLEYFRDLRIVPLPSKTAPLTKASRVIYAPFNNQYIKDDGLVQALMFSLYVTARCI